MALKAGTVGIDPKYVDKNGKPVSDVDLSNYYTKTETDGKLDLKANKSYLTANNKVFNFAYDAESGKYGYKAGAQDDFHPFESAGGPGWVAPASPITTGLTYASCEYESGGYFVDDGVCYVDIIVKVTTSSNLKVQNLPAPSGTVYLNFNRDTTVAAVEDNYTQSNSPSQMPGVSSGGELLVSSSYTTTGQYWHFFGQYATTT